MKIAFIGGGPGGLYFAISMKLRNPEHEITVINQNMPYNTFCWGIIFSDQNGNPSTECPGKCRNNPP